MPMPMTIKVQSGRFKGVKVDGYLETVHFHPLGPSSFIPLDRPVFAFSTVRYHFLGVSSLESQLGTIKFHHFGPSNSIRLDRPVFGASTLSLLNRSVWIMIIQFQSFGPSTLTPMDRTLWPKTVHFRLDSQQLPKLRFFCKSQHTQHWVHFILYVGIPCKFILFFFTSMGFRLMNYR